MQSYFRNRDRENFPSKLQTAEVHPKPTYALEAHSKSSAEKPTEKHNVDKVRYLMIQDAVWRTQNVFLGDCGPH